MQLHFHDVLCSGLDTVSSRNSGYCECVCVTAVSPSASLLLIWNITSVLLGGRSKIMTLHALQFYSILILPLTEPFALLVCYKTRVAVDLYVLQVISPASRAVHKAFTVLSAGVKGALSLEPLCALWDSPNRPCRHCAHI